MVNETNKTLRPLYTLFMVALSLVVFFDYSLRLSLIELAYVPQEIQNANISQLAINTVLDFVSMDNYSIVMLTLRLLLILMIYQYWLVQSSYIKDYEKWKSKKSFYTVILIIGIFFLLLGFYQVSIANYFIIPISYILTQQSIAFLCKSKANLETNEDQLKELPKSKLNDLSFDIPTDKGILRISQPCDGIGIVGAAGTGKSFYVLMKIHYQWIKKGYSAFIYDFKGNPPTLGHDAWQMVYQLNKQGFKTPKFHIFNPSAPLGSVRINPLDPINIPSKTHARNLAITMLKNLDKEAIEKSDFWNKNAQSIIENTIYTNATYKKEFSSIPHLVALTLRPIENLCNYLIHHNPMVKKDMLAVIDAYEKQAESQLAGVIATTALPIASLNVPEIFYLTSSSEMSLDISNKSDPSILVCCSNPSLKEALQPIIGLITSQVINNNGSLSFVIKH